MCIFGVWQVVINTRAPQGTVLSLFLFTLYTTDFSHCTETWYLHQFYNESVVVGCNSESDEIEYRAVVDLFFHMLRACCWGSRLRIICVNCVNNTKHTHFCWLLKEFMHSQRWIEPVVIKATTDGAEYPHLSQCVCAFNSFTGCADGHFHSCNPLHNNVQP